MEKMVAPPGREHVVIENMAARKINNGEAEHRRCLHFPVRSSLTSGAV